MICKSCNKNSAFSKRYQAITCTFNYCLKCYTKIFGETPKYEQTDKISLMRLGKETKKEESMQNERQNWLNNL